MLKSLVSALTLSLSLAVAAPMVHADDPKGDLPVALNQACQSDIQKYCSDVTKGEGHVMACLKAHDDKLSDTCSKQWTQSKAQWKAKMKEQHAACGSDVQKFCSDATTQKDISSCLSTHQSDLSASCKDFRSKSMAIG